MEHWLPLFHERLVDLFDYLAPGCAVSFDPLADEAHRAPVQTTIGEHYAARREPPEAARAMGAAPYRPLAPDELYLSERALEGAARGPRAERFFPVRGAAGHAARRGSR